MLILYYQLFYLKSPAGDEFIAKLNEYRSTQGAGPVKENDLLDKAAEVQATHLMNTKQCTHDGPPGNEDFKTRIQNCGYTNGTISENVAQNNAVNAADVFEQWKNSPGHNTNMINPDYNETGIAYKEDTDGKVYWASTFGGGGDSKAGGETKEDQGAQNSSEQPNNNQPQQENPSSPQKGLQQSSQIPSGNSINAMQNNIAAKARS